MNAFIACILHLDPEKLSEDEWHKAWARVKYYSSTALQIEFQ